MTRVKSAKVVLLLGPALTVIGVLFFGGLGVAFVRSLGPEISIDAYLAILADESFLRSFLLSFHIAFTSTLISAIIAVAAALLLRGTFAGRGIMSFLFQLNLTVPHLVGAIGILYLFSQSGSFARLAFAAGAIAKPGAFPALVFDPYAIGIILQYVWKEVPFIGLIVLAAMQSVGAEYETVARSLGASGGQAFRHVLWPMIRPAVTGGSVIVFAFTFGAYEIPLVLGASAPEALPVMAYRSFTNTDLTTRPQAMAMAVVIAGLSAVMIAVYLRAVRR